MSSIYTHSPGDRTQSHGFKQPRTEVSENQTHLHWPTRWHHLEDCRHLKLSMFIHSSKSAPPTVFCIFTVGNSIFFLLGWNIGNCHFWGVGQKMVFLWLNLVAHSTNHGHFWLLSFIPCIQPTKEYCFHLQKISRIWWIFTLCCYHLIQATISSNLDDGKLPDSSTCFCLGTLMVYFQYNEQGDLVILSDQVISL